MAEELLFEAIYEKGLNISDISTLEQIGEELQLPRVRLQPVNFFTAAIVSYMAIQASRPLQDSAGAVRQQE